MGRKVFKISDLWEHHEVMVVPIPFVIVFAHYKAMCYGFSFVLPNLLGWLFYSLLASFCNSKISSQHQLLSHSANKVRNVLPMCSWIGTQDQDLQYLRSVWIFHDLWEVWFPIYCLKRMEESKTNRKEISVKCKELLWVCYYFNTIFNIKEIK